MLVSWLIQMPHLWPLLRLGSPLPKSGPPNERSRTAYLILYLIYVMEIRKPFTDQSGFHKPHVKQKRTKTTSSMFDLC